MFVVTDVPVCFIWGGGVGGFPLTVSLQFLRRKWQFKTPCPSGDGTFFYFESFVLSLLLSKMPSESPYS